ncbi:MAG: PQQ-binding-like beta-propeller repeat protein [Tepidisphaeraceae bacterium]|jgi:outer membrane protein assembly factor BamB
MKYCAWFQALLLLSATVFAATPESFDWPQWQGPDRNGVSRERGLLKEWPKDGPALAWKTRGLGGGYSAPSVAAGRIFGMSNRGNNEVIWALSEADGKELWVAQLGPAIRQGMQQGIEGPGCTPTVDGDLLYVVGLGGDLSCLQAKDGKIVWQRSFTRDFGGRVPTWRFNESPLVDGDKVICTPGGPDAMLVALEKSTGKTIWKSQMPGGAAAGGGAGAPAGGRGGRGGGGGGGGSGAAYASAIAIDFEGQRQYVQLTAKALIGVAVSDGKFLWRYDKPANRMGINCSTPVYQDGQVFAASAYGAGGGLVKLSKDANGGVKAEEVYFTSKMQNHHGGMILLDGCLYGANGGNEGGNLICLDFKTGNVLWDGREVAKSQTPKGSILLADGRIYYHTEQGATLLIEPNPKQYIERGRFDQPDRSDKPAWPHPVVANGKLYLRDQDVLLCYDVKAK